MSRPSLTAIADELIERKVADALLVIYAKLSAVSPDVADSTMQLAAIIAGTRRDGTWADVPLETMRLRVREGWSLRRAITTPPGPAASG